MNFALLPTRLISGLFMFLGRLMERRGNQTVSEYCFNEARNYNPRNAFASYSIGRSLLQKGDLKGAIREFRRALDIRDSFPEARNNLGVALDLIGNFSDAVACYQRVLADRPNFAAAHNNLGNVHYAESRLADAMASYRAALAIDPDYVEALSNLGMILNALTKFAEAETYCQRAISLDPRHAGAHLNLGNIQRCLGRLEEALASYKEAIALDPKLMQAKINLAILSGEYSGLAQAIPYYENALERYPDSFQSHLNLGRALSEAGRLDDAQIHFEKALALNPNSAETFSAAGNNFTRQANNEMALSSYASAFKLQESAQARQSYLFHLNYQTGMSAEEIFFEHRQWAAVFCASFKQAPGASHHSFDAEKRLRIGYVSSDLRQHSVAYFIEPILRHHDRKNFEIHCFPDVGSPDAMTDRLRALTDVWHDIHLKRETSIVEIIRQNEIDILVDLSGHSAGNRLAIFAQKAAPLQMSYLGYPNTTGLHTIDYRITDAIADPPGLTETFFSEELLRLPNSFLTYQSPANSPEVAPCPAFKNGYVTFGSFNNVAKVNEQVIALWSQILHAVPDSRLMLKGFSFTSQNARDRFRAWFMRFGITADRVDLVNFVPTVSGHLDLYAQIDIALDPFPYNGTTTTCEALWMGVPVVVLDGNTHVSRVGVSLLTNIGLENLIASSWETYLKIATDLAMDLNVLSEMRSVLRPKVQASPLMDAQNFTHNLEAAYRSAWRTTCATHQSEIADNFSSDLTH